MLFTWNSVRYGNGQNDRYSIKRKTQVRKITFYADMVTMMVALNTKKYKVKYMHISSVFIWSNKMHHHQYENRSRQWKILRTYITYNYTMYYSMTMYHNRVFWKKWFSKWKYFSRCLMAQLLGLGIKGFPVPGFNYKCRNDDRHEVCETMGSWLSSIIKQSHTSTSPFIHNPWNFQSKTGLKWN